MKKLRVLLSIAFVWVLTSGMGGCMDKSISIVDSTGVEITIEEGSGDIHIEPGCCDDEQEQDFSRCWSTCWSKNELDPAECAACARGERDCVWPWEVDYECLQE